jgi:hypothetical protein
LKWKLLSSVQLSTVTIDSFAISASKQWCWLALILGAC